MSSNTLDISSNTLVELVRIGFPGVAVVILIFSFWLLRGITTNPNLSVEAVSVRAREVRFFMIGSVVVILLALGWVLVTPRVTIYFDVNPDSIDGFVIRAAGERVEWKEGKNTIEVPDKQEITLDLNDIENKLKEFDSQLTAQKEYARGVKEAQLKVATGNLQSQQAGF